MRGGGGAATEKTLGKSGFISVAKKTGTEAEGGGDTTAFEVIPTEASHGGGGGFKAVCSEEMRE